MHDLIRNSGWIIRPTAVRLAIALAPLTIIGAPGCDRPAPDSSTEPAAITPAPASRPSPPVTSAPDARPTRRPPRPDADPRLAEFAEYTAPKPVKWQWQPPTEAAHIANYVVPDIARPGEVSPGQAHLLITRDPSRSEDAILGEWAGRFLSPGGESILPLIGTTEVDGADATILEVSGAQIRPGATWPTRDQMLLGLILPQENGSILVTLSGPRPTVDENREAFFTLIEGIERR